MYHASDRFQRAPKGAPTLVTYADVYHGDEFVTRLTETGDGNLDRDEEAAIRWTYSSTLVDTEGDLVPTSARTDILNPYRAALHVHKGFRFADGTEETVPCGVYRFRTIEVGEEEGALSIRVEGFDASIACQKKLPRPYVVTAGESIESEIARLLTTVLPSLSFRLPTTGFTAPALLLRGGDEPWAQAVKLAESAGCSLSMGRDGVCEMSPKIAQASQAYAWRYEEGENADFWTPTRTLTLDDLANVVIVEGTNSGTAAIRAVAADGDPTSDTYRRGPLGEQVVVVESERVTTAAQAQAMANGKLVEMLGPSETVEFVASPNPALDLGDTVLVTRERLGIVDRPMIVQRVGLSNDVGTGMLVSARRSILTGALNPFGEAVAA